MLILALTLIGRKTPSVFVRANNGLSGQTVLSGGNNGNNGNGNGNNCQPQQIESTDSIR